MNSVDFLCLGRFGGPIGDVLLNRVAASLNSAVLFAVVGVPDKRILPEHIAGVSMLYLVVAVLQRVFKTVLSIAVPSRGGFSSGGDGLLSLA